MTTVLEQLVRAVDCVTRKVGGIKSRLNMLEEEIRLPRTASQESLGQWQSGDEHLFNVAGGVRPKQRTLKQNHE